MKMLLTLGLLTLCLLSLGSAGTNGPQLVLMDGCCLRYSRIPVPENKVKHAAMTPSGCRPAAVIVTAESGKKFCVDPEWRWAKTQLAKFSS